MTLDKNALEAAARVAAGNVTEGQMSANLDLAAEVRTLARDTITAYLSAPPGENKELIARLEGYAKGEMPGSWRARLLREAAAALEDADVKVAELRKQRDDEIAYCERRIAVAIEATLTAVDRASTLAAEVERMREALIASRAHIDGSDLRGDMLEVIDAALTAPAPGGERNVSEDGWRDIASAEPPHDIPVILYSPPMFGHPDGLIEVRPYSTGHKGARSYHSHATHWRPLPASPRNGGE